MENTDYIDGSVTTCWLRDFLRHLEREEEYTGIRVAIGTEEEFATALQNYLGDEPVDQMLDIEWDGPDKKRVKAARFIIQVGKMGN